MVTHYPRSGPLMLRTHLSDRANTHAIVSGEVTSPLVRLDVCGPKAVSKGFKPLVREGAFQFSELSIMTYLQAKAHGKRLVLLPAVVLGRFQHEFLACRADDDIRPGDLEGRRVGVRSYTVTTVTWARAILQLQYGVAIDEVIWVAHEDSHLAEFRDPPTVERIELDGRTLEQLLIDGVVDVAVLSRPPTDPRLRSLIADPAAAAKDWYDRFGGIQINHMVVVEAALSAERPDVVREIYAMLLRAKQIAARTEHGIDVLPFGVDANRRNLELAIGCAAAQDLIPDRFEVDDLFDETTRALGRAPASMSATR